MNTNAANTKEAKMTKKATVKVEMTQEQAKAITDLIAAAMTARDTAADSDEWCRFCGEGHGFHEDNCPVNHPDVPSATMAILSGLRKAYENDDLRARNAATTAHILEMDAARRNS